MKREIEEILEELKRRNELFNDLDGDIETTPIEYYEAHILLDYITNLQQENERLKQELVKIPRAKMEYDLELEDYKSRCEKAIEYIKSNPNVYYDENLIDVETLLNNEFTDEYAGEIRFISTLLSILQNGSENQ